MMLRTQSEKSLRTTKTVRFEGTPRPISEPAVAFAATPINTPVGTPIDTPKAYTPTSSVAASTPTSTSALPSPVVFFSSASLFHHKPAAVQACQEEKKPHKQTRQQRRRTEAERIKEKIELEAEFARAIRDTEANIKSHLQVYQITCNDAEKAIQELKNADSKKQFHDKTKNASQELTQEVGILAQSICLELNKSCRDFEKTWSTSIPTRMLMDEFHQHLIQMVSLLDLVDFVLEKNPLTLFSLLRR